MFHRQLAKAKQVAGKGQVFKKFGDPIVRFALGGSWFIAASISAICWYHFLTLTHADATRNVMGGVNGGDTLCSRRGFGPCCTPGAVDFSKGKGKADSHVLRGFVADACGRWRYVGL